MAGRYSRPVTIPGLTPRVEVEVREILKKPAPPITPAPPKSAKKPIANADLIPIPSGLKWDKRHCFTCGEQILLARNPDAGKVIGHLTKQTAASQNAEVIGKGWLLLNLDGTWHHDQFDVELYPSFVPYGNQYGSAKLDDLELAKALISNGITDPSQQFEDFGAVDADLESEMSDYIKQDMPGFENLGVVDDNYKYAKPVCIHCNGPHCSSEHPVGYENDAIYTKYPCVYCGDPLHCGRDCLEDPFSED